MAYKYISESFNSIDAMLRTIEKRPVNKVFKYHECSSENEGSSFSGTSSYKEAVELMKGGWSEPTKDLKAEASALKVKANATTQKARPRNAVVGYAPCVPAAIMGLPESMIATERVPTKIKAVTIVYASCDNAGTTTKQFLKAGAVILKIVNDLELKGYRVRLICEFYAAQKNNERLVGRVTVKDWRQPLDLKKIAFPIAHSSMLRRVGFKWIETQPEISQPWYSGYGRAIASEEDSYEDVVKAYKENGLLCDNEYYTSLQMVAACEHDSAAVMKRAGMSL